MDQLDKIARFQALHESGCFVMPNVRACVDAGVAGLSIEVAVPLARC